MPRALPGYPGKGRDVVFRSDLGGFTGARVPHLLEVVDPLAPLVHLVEEGRYQATWKREFILPWRKAGPLKSSR